MSKSRKDIIDATAKPAPAMPEPNDRQLPAVPQDVEGRALNAMTPSSESGGTLSLPRIVALQSLSKEVTREEDPLKPGILYNKLTKEALGKSLEFIPIGTYSQRILLKLDRGLVCRSMSLMGPAQMFGGLTADGEETNNCTVCVLKDWPRDRLARGENLNTEQQKRGPECSVVINFPSLMVNGVKPEDYELVLLSFTRTSIAAANDLVGLQRMSRKPWYSSRYWLKLEKGSGPNNATFYKQVIARGAKTSEEEIRQAVDTIKFLGSKRQDIDEGLSDEIADEERVAETASAGSDRF